jgi:hypothetical protein
MTRNVSSNNHARRSTSGLIFFLGKAVNGNTNWTDALMHITELLAHLSTHLQLVFFLSDVQFYWFCVPLRNTRSSSLNNTTERISCEKLLAPKLKEEEGKRMVTIPSSEPVNFCSRHMLRFAKWLECFLKTSVSHLRFLSPLYVSLLMMDILLLFLYPSCMAHAWHTSPVIHNISVPSDVSAVLAPPLLLQVKLCFLPVKTSVVFLPLCFM